MAEIVKITSEEIIAKTCVVSAPHHTGGETMRIGCGDIKIHPSSCGYWGTKDSPGDTTVRCSVDPRKLRDCGPICEWRESVPEARISKEPQWPIV